MSYFNNGSGIEVLEENNYYPFGLKHEGYNALDGNPAYQYKYNGKELQTETGMYDYGARFYMPDIGRWGVQDELSEKFSSHSNYNYVLNNPINGIDPDGRDVIFIGDSKAVPLYGHGAVIIGNEKDGWYYYSMNGTGEGSSPYGDSKNPDIGTFLGYGLSPKQAVLKANSVNPNEKHNYDKYGVVKTTKEEDAKMKQKAAEAASKKKYIVIGQSCVNVPLAAFNELIAIRANEVKEPPYVNYFAPNAFLNNLRNTINNVNKYLPIENKIEPRKKAGKLIVGPVIPIDENGKDKKK
ncbi:RHS repeat-associated core domain-containing protein [Chryseobacterium sp. MHB01]|uniref:RHS repeat domain-containing protein n=1 Tax=Chryseobacterium sp. MHB01 TaxID=3109433 RepID=UPI002AFFB0B0